MQMQLSIMANFWTVVTETDNLFDDKAISSEINFAATFLQTATIWAAASEKDQQIGIRRSGLARIEAPVASVLL